MELIELENKDAKVDGQVTWKRKEINWNGKRTKEGNGEIDMIKIIMYENVTVKPMYICMYIT